MQEWMERYYEELNPDKRQNLLTAHLQETEKETGELLLKLWDARYGKGRPKKDAFIGYLMNLKYIAESGSADFGGKKRKLAVETIHGLGICEFDKKEEWEKEILTCELKNTCEKYIEISANGRGFTSVLFGMGQLSDDSVAQKIAQQLSSLIYEAPHILRMEKEFAVLQKAGAEAFRKVYPSREHYLRKR